MENAPEELPKPLKLTPLSTDCNSEQDRGQFEIAKVISSRARQGKTEYLVQWKGLDESHNTWVSERDLNQIALNSFRDAQPPLRRSARLRSKAFNARTFAGAQCPRTEGMLVESSTTTTLTTS